MTPFDPELSDRLPEQRWREWMARIEAVIFASATPVPRDRLVPLVGAEASVDLLIEDLKTAYADRAFELVELGGGWMFRTRPRFADAIRAAADLGERPLPFSEMEMAVLSAIAYHQPIDRAALADLFGKPISPDLISRLRHRDLIANGPRAPRRGAPQTFVTTETFLATFDLQSLRDLPDPAEQ